MQGWPQLSKKSSLHIVTLPSILAVVTMANLCFQVVVLSTHCSFFLPNTLQTHLIYTNCFFVFILYQAASILFFWSLLCFIAAILSIINICTLKECMHTFSQKKRNNLIHKRLYAYRNSQVPHDIPLSEVKSFLVIDSAMERLKSFYSTTIWIIVLNSIIAFVFCQKKKV